MKKISPLVQLQESILLLEIKQANELALFKAELRTTYESLKPINLVKDTFSELMNSPNLKENIIEASLSLAAGYVSKKLIFGSTHNPIKQILGSLIQVGVTSIISKNADNIKSSAIHLMANMFSKNDKPS